MKKIVYLSSFLLFFTACNNNSKSDSSEPSSDINVVSDFIKAALKGDYETAKTYMIGDSLSLQRMNNIARVNLSSEEKKGLADANINIHSVKRINDSTTIVIYSNSYKNNRDTLRALRMKGKWLIDFNYLFDHDLDTLNKQTLENRDSVK